jgi:GNAT superfamily N-acetyltransferase
VHGEIIEATSLPALMAENRHGLATYRRLDRDAELVTLDADPTGVGTGTALIEALVARLRVDGCECLWLTTTNDKLSALRFYLQRDFRLIQVRLGAVDAARRLKPSIPMVGEYGIPIRDELDLCRVLDTRIARGELFLPPWTRPISKRTQASNFTTRIAARHGPRWGGRGAAADHEADSRRHAARVASRPISATQLSRFGETLAELPYGGSGRLV